MELTKKQKANAMACLIESGFYDYFDKIKWLPKRHKFLYVYDLDCKAYLSQKELAQQFDTLEIEDRNYALERLEELGGII